MSKDDLSAGSAPGDLLPLREAADELGPDTALRRGPSTTMLRRAWDDEVVKLVRIGRALYIERGELQRVKRELRCSVCGTLTLGKRHPDGRRYCQPHRGKANTGKSIAAGTRAPTSEVRIGEDERKRRRKAMKAANDTPEWRKAMLAAHARLWEERREAFAAEGLTTAQLAARVGLSRTTITEQVRRGVGRRHFNDSAPRPDPTTATVRLPGRPAYLWTPELVEDYERWLAHHPDGRLQRFAGGEPSRDVRDRSRLVVGPDEAARFNAAWRQASGLLEPTLPLEAAAALVRPVVKARRSVLRFRAGSPRGARKEQLHAEWTRLYDEILDWWREREEVDLLLGRRGRAVRRARPLQVCLMIAKADHAAAPDRWKYDPAARPERAARRIRMAIRRHKAA